MAEVQGLDQFVKALGETSLNLTQKRKLIEKSLRKGAVPVKAEQQRLAPDDPETVGSRIRDNIGISVVDQTATSGEGRIGPTKHIRISLFSELGTTHQTGKPFVGPSLTNKEEVAVKIIGDVMGDGIEEAYRIG